MHYPIVSDLEEDDSSHSRPCGLCTLGPKTNIRFIFEFNAPVGSCSLDGSQLVRQGHSSDGQMMIYLICLQIDHLVPYLPS